MILDQHFPSPTRGASKSRQPTCLEIFAPQVRFQIVLVEFFLGRRQVHRLHNSEGFVSGAGRGGIFCCHMRFLPVLVMVFAGFFISIQGPVNARLRVAVKSPVLSAAISFLSGGLVLLCIMATGAFGGTGAGLRGMQTAPFG